MKIDTHGLKMVGLKKASGETWNYAPYIGWCDEIFYDLHTGDVWTNFHVSENSWTEYHDPDIVRVCVTSRHMTMQEIADAIARRIEELK